MILVAFNDDEFIFTNPNETDLEEVTFAEKISVNLNLSNNLVLRNMTFNQEQYQIVLKVRERRRIERGSPPD